MANEPAVIRPATAFWRALTRFEQKKIVPEIALRNTIGFAAALIIATVLGSSNAGVLAAIGALNVSYSDSRDPYITRMRRMCLSAVLCAIAVTLGALSGRNNATAVVAAVLWAFASGMLVALGSIAGDLGVITLVTIVVFAARPLPPLAAAQAGLVALGGGLLQMLLAIALWPVRRYEPERRIIASLYSALAVMARSPGAPSSAPPVSNQISDAQDALSSLTGDHSVEAERLVFLLNQAERIRLTILTLGRLSRRIGRDERGREPALALSEVLQGAAIALEYIGLASAANTALEPFAQAAAAFRRRDSSAYSAFFAALVRDAGQQLDALGGQLRAASKIAGAGTDPPAGIQQPIETREPWFLRFPGRLARIQANLSLDSTIFRHALRLAVCIGMGDALGRSLSLSRTYWIPMTIAIVLKPDFTTTISRGVLRISGTFAGLILATVLFQFIHTGIVTDIVLMTVFVFLLRWIGPANYGIFVTALSAMIVLLIATTGVPPKDVISARAVNTAMGGALAMVAYAIWPTWEKTQVGPALADMLDAYRDYFSAVFDAYLGGTPAAIDSTRVKARRARSNAEASVDRMSGEPGISPDRINTLNAILVNSHSFVHAAMALEAGLNQTGKAPARAATARFAHMVEDTLAAISTALRTSHSLPRPADLREAHNEILNSPEAPTDRYALVNVETDRITTSLNTVFEQAADWVNYRRVSPQSSAPEA